MVILLSIMMPTVSTASKSSVSRLLSSRPQCALSRKPFRSSAANGFTTRCSALPQYEAPLVATDRRSVLVGMTLALAAGGATTALAEGTSTFYGLASPPTSYGGYGGNAKEDAKYAFEHPPNWKPEVINKVEKGTQGIDCRVYNPKNKAQQVFVVTFGRAGEDNKNFKLGDAEQTLAGFAGADYQLQDALTDATSSTSGRHEVNGQLFYDYEITSPDVTYLSTITVNRGKVYAVFVKSPAKMFKSDEPKLRAIIESFRTI